LGFGFCQTIQRIRFLSIGFFAKRKVVFGTDGIFAGERESFGDFVM
jgi:hypothetical protein